MFTNIYELMYCIKVGIWDALHDKLTVTGVSTSYLSASLLFNVNFDWSVFVGILGALAAVSSAVKHTIDAVRSWNALKKERAELLKEQVEEQLEKEKLLKTKNENDEQK